MYIGSRWKEPCERSHVVRSISRKARSPGNARAEGFFEARDWTGAGFKEFRRRLDEYIKWYRSSKLKKSLG